LNLAGILNLDSLVDIVSNNVGILIILAAFMALFTLIDPARLGGDAVSPPREAPPRRLLVPWSHPTNKNHLFLALRENRVQFFDLRPVFLNLAGHDPGERPEPVTIEEEGLRVRFFPVTNQVYCLEFTPRPGFGEDWLRAQRPDSVWQGVLRRYPPEKYVYFFWVNGDSFELFRQVRDSLWERQVEVGWKPAEKDAPLEVCNGFEGSTAFRPQ
jgi:hypothetical protein